MELENKTKEELIEIINTLYNTIHANNTNLLEKKNYSVSSISGLCVEETPLEAFSRNYGQFIKSITTKHKSSDYVSLSFISIDGQILDVKMTEKSYLKLFDMLNIFKIKFINTRQFEE